MAAQILNALLGIWLMAAPGIFGYEKSIANNNHIIGPIIATFAITACFESTRSVRKVNIFLGLWLLLAPWILGYSSNTTATVNDMVVGVLVIGLSLVRGTLESKFGGGWKSLWQDNSPHEQEAKRIF